MKTTTDKQDWTPRRRGRLYCSPACGGGCTHAAFTKATRSAQALAERLGPKWKPRVWENLGWHFSAASDVGEVHDHGSNLGARRFWADLKADGSQFEAEGSTPEVAIENAIRPARELMKAIEALQGKLSDPLKQ